MQVWIEWVKAHPTETLIYAIVISRIIVKYTPTDIDNKILAAIMVPVTEIAKLIGIVIPTDEQAIEKKIDQVIGEKIPTAPVGIIREVSTGAILQLDRPRGRPLLRTMVRRIAERNGLDASKLTDTQIDEVIAEATHSAGPIKDLLSWIFANPEKLLAIIKVLLMVFAEEKPTVDPGVTT